MAALPLTGNAFHKAEMKYHGKFGHTLGRIQHIAIIIIIGISYANFHIETQTLAPTLPGFQGIKRCVQYLARHPHKPIFYCSYYYYGSNFIRLTWSVNQFEDYTTQNFLEFRQDVDHAIVINIRRPSSVILHHLLGVDVCC